MIMKLITIPLNKLEMNENSRVIYKRAELGELMHSMKLHGLLQPVGAKALPNGRYDVVYGFRRLMAAIKLEWKEIDAVEIEPKDETDRDILNLVENIKRQNTSPAEDGRIFHIMLDRGISVQEIAARLDVSTQRVQLALDIYSQVPAEYRPRIQNRPMGKAGKGAISATAAHAILDLKKREGLNKAQLKTLLDYAGTKGASVQHIGSLAPFIKQGASMGEALQFIQHLERVSLDIFVPRKNKEKIERKYKKPITQFIWDVLEALPELDVRRSIRPKYEGKISERDRKASESR
jgi:ParB/RepB/Spo0J family partition protein